MPIAVGFVQTNTITSAGTQEFRDSRLGETPNVAIVFMTPATVAGSVADGAGLSVGFCTGAAERCLALYDQHGQATTVTRKATRNTTVALLDAAGAVVAEAIFSAFLANTGSGAGVRLNWTTAPPAAYVITILMGRADNPTVGDYLTGSAAGALTTVTLGYRPGFILALSAGGPVPAGSAGLLASIGLVVDDGALRQACAVFKSEDGAAAAAVASRLMEGRLAGAIDSAGAESWSSEVTNLTGSGFIVTQRTAGGGGAEVAYLAVEVDDIELWLEVIDLPTAAGLHSFTGPGFGPSLVFQILTSMEATDTAYTGERAGAWALSAAAGYGREFSAAVATEAGEETTDTQSLVALVFNYLADDGGANLIVGSLPASGAFTATGWQVNYSLLPATATKAITLVAGQSPAPGGGGGGRGRPGGLRPVGSYYPVRHLQ